MLYRVGSTIDRRAAISDVPLIEACILRASLESYSITDRGSSRGYIDADSEGRNHVEASIYWGHFSIAIGYS